ncbi:putative RNA polymerase II subunit B1 CTD phosphatase R08D7.2 [Lachnellula arida]|uniref:RNA polymerase II subunit B1 CTD phosphatase RPAP2 homolog n=1 Tax=Lachnellula arida TaxID=1316785 RepID=A0A8T9BD59_9HELO|nr:putative RNA polymerase II subunit B1 CTD phosphatase R08D7.2 [Lachnellula arida]
MATSQMPKSILKKTSYPATTTSKEDRDRELALYHAELIQQRKDIELEILLSTETLIDYPLATAPYDASNPSPADAKTFKDLLRPFQPSDYDALIVERNINERCGYTLCANPPRKESGGGRWRMVGKHGKGKDFRVVDKKELEKWCSEACAIRALYVRVQLSETAAWERGERGENTVKIELRDEPKSDSDTVVEGLEKLELAGDDNIKKQDTAHLALERGDRGPAARIGSVDVKILEKEIQRAPEAPSLEDQDLTERLDTMHLALEGHTTSFGCNRYRRREEEEEDTDWKL